MLPVFLLRKVSMPNLKVKMFFNQDPLIGQKDNAEKPQKIVKIKNKKKTIFKLKKKLAGRKFKIFNGASHPPKKNKTIIVAIKSILLYSPKKNIAKIIDEYSTL